MHDLVVRGGTLVDGTGDAPRQADVAVDDGVVTEVGRLPGVAARRTIDADGLTVTPGFVDIHTHYDGQATWDPLLAPSAWHGVTTVVMGNCGVGFAPVRPGSEDWLIGLMEGVEDIPGTALAEGITWDWESFPEYLDALERLPHTIDVGTQVPHGAVRAYVMGERGARNEPAGPEDIAAMSAIVEEGLRAGALGFSTSRTLAHRAIDGEPVPGTFAAEDELFGIGDALRRAGRGIFELAPAGSAGEDIVRPKDEVDWMWRLSKAIGRPVTFALLQVDAAPDLWRELFDVSVGAVGAGAQVYPQVAGRPFGLLVGLQTTHAFLDRPSYRAIADRPLAQRVAAMRDPAFRQRLLAEEPEGRNAFASFVRSSYEKMFVLGNPVDYEPGPERSIAAMAAAEGRTAEEVLYDALLADDGRAFLVFPLLNYSEGNADAIREMLMHPQGALGLGDGGAHCGIICDASIPTFMLTHWVRDRTRGPRLPIEYVIKKMTHDTAQLYGMPDRGVVRAGAKADLNVIDLPALRLDVPRLAHDLPAGGRRLLQRAEGYVDTVVSGEVVLHDGEETGARPGHLVRGARP
jgi:N-acyl-D-amino-acid deacylase